MRTHGAASAASRSLIQARGKGIRKAIPGSLLALALVVVFAGTALATAASGFSAVVQARGTMSESVHFNTGEVKVQTKGPVDFVTSLVNFAAPGSSGWHHHPGVLLVTVKSGSLRVYAADCSFTVHTAGTSSSAFTESGDEPGLVRNESTTTPVVAYVTYLVPAGTAALRIDDANPGCPRS